MRNPDRLDEFYAEMCKIHKEVFPDWRFGQFCNNFFYWLGATKKIDLFFPEEKQMIGYLKEYVKEIKGE